MEILYVNCPLCREMNINIEKPFKNYHKRNILMMSWRYWKNKVFM